MVKTDPQSNKPVLTSKLIEMGNKFKIGVRKTSVGLGERKYKSVRLDTVGLEVSVDNYGNCPRGDHAWWLICTMENGFIY